MYIKELTLKDFRNYDNIHIDFSPHFNFIIGENGVGKTNILEAISITSQIKSFRNIHDSEIIRWQSNSYFCSSIVGDNDFYKFNVGCAISDRGIKKKLKIDGIEIKKASEFYGKLLTVIFSPIDIDLINGGPDLRRKYFDSVISKIDSQYFSVLSDLKKILTSRNQVLKNLRESNSKNYKELDVWDEIFAEKSSVIINKRINFLKIYNDLFLETYHSISNEESPLIYYHTINEIVDSECIKKELIKKRMKDIIFGYTSIGPQRDDYRIGNNEGNLFINYASQGQKRTAAIALKSAECTMIENERGKKSVILVDDIFSELDKNRRKNMIEILSKGNQIIFTMVNNETIDINNFVQNKQFLVEKPGKVSEI